MKTSGLIPALLVIGRGINNNCYLGVAPADAVLPYCVIQLLPAAPVSYQTDGVDVTQNIPISIMTYHAGLAECSSEMVKYEVAFSHIHVDNSYGRILDSFITSQNIYPDENRLPSGEEVWCGTMKIDLLTERNLS